MTDPTAYFASLPTRRAVAGVLLGDGHGRVLLVKPTYRDGWLLPGGTVDAGEAPWAAAARELREELGLDLSPGALVCIQHFPGDEVATEALHFVFRGADLDAATVARITLPPDELCDHRFAAFDEAMDLSPRMQHARLRAAWPVPPGAAPVLLG
jgi:8-oxo-dGTP pyrophosphatase MutT (NUDIX family)